MRNLSTAVLTLSLLLCVNGFNLAYAANENPLGEACQGAGASSPACAPSTDPISGGDSQDGLLIKATQLVAYATAIAAVFMIIYSGLRYIMSGDDSNKTQAAKDTLLYAIIGLAVAAFAQAIVSFVLKNL